MRGWLGQNAVCCCLLSLLPTGGGHHLGAEWAGQALNITCHLGTVGRRGPEHRSPPGHRVGSTGPERRHLGTGGEDRPWAVAQLRPAGGAVVSQPAEPHQALVPHL